MKSRILIVFFGLLVLGSIILLRAAWIQFLPNEKLKSLQARQFQTVITLPSRRGPIVDREGKDLALSSAAFSLYADPSIIKNRTQAARDLSRVLNLSSRHIYSRIKDKNRRFVWIQRRLDRSTMEKVNHLKIKGFRFVEEWKRTYPSEQLLSPVIGKIGQDGQGLEGLELFYENELRGSTQKVSVKRDARGRPLVSEGLLFRENPEGFEIQLTIDSELQYQLENELEKTVAEFEANGAMGIILDAQTSAIRAMGNLYRVSGQSGLAGRNHTITDFFEPGSVIKPLVVAKGLANGDMQPNSKFDCEMGQWKVGKHFIRESDSKHQFGVISVSEILAFSSNIGTGKMALKMGSEKLRQGLADFGFGEKSGVDLPGEVRGLLHKLPWGDHQTANNSFGQGMAATALQVVNAYAVLANGGVLKRPYIVDRIRNIETGNEKINEPKEIRRVITPSQAESMRMMLTAVTQEKATGAAARVPGFQVAGKTGTAQKARVNGRGYEPGAYISSFAGLLPAHKPEFVIYVVVDTPRKAYYASQVAAPLFSRVASFAVRKAGLSPSLLGHEDYQRSFQQQVHMAKKQPKNSKPVAVDVAAILQGEKRNGDSRVPSLLNLSLRQALEKMQGQSVKIKAVGQGQVIGTFPREGEPLRDDETVTIFLQ
jgi:cell division protein FtsI (penicillin-binding protein 3)